MNFTGRPVQNLESGDLSGEQFPLSGEDGPQALLSEDDSAGSVVDFPALAGR